MSDSPAYILIVTKFRDDAFTTLFFEGLPAELRRHLRVLEFGRDWLTSALAGAAAVIVMRHGLFSFGNLSACAGLVGVPRYYFLDDNLLLLHEEPEVYGPYWSQYTDDNVRRALSGYAGVLLASRPLMAYFAERRLHDRLMEFPPMAGPILRPRAPGPAAGEPFRIAFFGGEHRRDLFVTVVFPAAQRLALDRPVELVLAGIDAGALGATPGLSVVHLPYEVSYGKALAQLATHRIDALAHPTPPSRNNPFRNANVVINARAIGAVSLLSNMPPYDALGPQPPAVLCDNTAEAWYDALARVAADRGYADEVFARAMTFCEEEFSGALNASAIARMLADHAPPGRWTRAARSVIAGAPLGGDRLNATARRLMSRRVARSRLS